MTLFLFIVGIICFFILIRLIKEVLHERDARIEANAWADAEIRVRNATDKSEVTIINKDEADN